MTLSPGRPMLNRMTTSLGGALLCVSLVLPGTLMAQESAPQTLSPQTLILQPQAPAADTGASEPAAVIGVEGIQINSLANVAADTAGALSAETGGYPFDMWAGSSRAGVDALFARLPVNTRSAAMRSMMRRVLMSQAQPPATGAQSVAVLEGEFVLRRVEVLSAMGDTAGVSDMLANMPGRQSDERLMRLDSDVKLLRGDFVPLCGRVGELMESNPSIYWQKLMILCQVLSGRSAEADLSLALMREIGVQDDLLFLMLDSMIRGDVPIIEALPDPTPLHVALIRASKARLGVDALDSPQPAVLAALSGNADLDTAMRLVAAEQAVAAGAMPVSALRELFASIVFEADDLANPLSSAEAGGGAFGRALLYQAAMAQSVDGAKAEATSLALSMARADAMYAPTAQVFLPIISAVPARSDLVWFAGDAVRAFMLTGQSDVALEWLALLRSNSSFSSEAAEALAMLVPVVELAGLDEAGIAGSAGLSAWLSVSRQSDVGREQAVMLFTLLENLDQPIDADIWETLGFADSGKTGALPDPVLWQRLDAAAHGGRIGDSVLLSLISLGESGPAQSSPLALGHVVRNLTLAGMESDARALSVEAALAAGL